MATAIRQIRERVEEILENIVPDVEPSITLRKWLGSRDITTAEHTESAATTTRQFQIITYPIRDPGFLGGGSVDQWQTVRITIRYYISDRPDGWQEAHDLAAADSAAIYEHLLDDTQWVGTDAVGAALGDAQPLTPSPTISNLGLQVLNYRVMYNRCSPGLGGKWVRNFTDLVALTAYLQTKDLGTVACLIDSDRALIQRYTITSYGVEELNVPTVKGPVERGAASLPQTTQTPYFTVTGRVMVLKIIGEVTTVIQAQANSIKLVSNPTVGADVDLCAALDINADTVGTLYTVTGTLSDAMVATTSGAVQSQLSGIDVAAGTIDLDATASSTGATKWTVHYVPIDDGATVTAA